MIDLDQTRTSVIAAVKRAKVDRHPFAHFQLEKIFPESVYRTLIDNIPDPGRYHEIRHKDAPSAGRHEHANDAGVSRR